MAQQRVVAMEYIRAFAMLGVLGIHTGAYSLSNPQVNIHLFALLEIVSRFSVPIFFFVSAFGLFYNKSLEKPFHYGEFLQKRGRSVLLPYVVWSVLYMLHYTYTSGDTSIWSASYLIEAFLFGLTQYHLYWLVMLMWFYALMPLWRVVLRIIVSKPITYLVILLLLQIGFNYYSSYLLKADFANPYVNILVRHRLNYVVLHYLFIFLLGGVCALRYQECKQVLTVYSKYVYGLLVVSLVSILGWYYSLVKLSGYDPEQAVSTVHQLSPAGVVYTLAAALFFVHVFEAYRLPQWLAAFLQLLGKYSYSVYLVHPLVMYYLMDFEYQQDLMMTMSVVILFYLAALCGSLLLAWLLDRVGQQYPLLGWALNGSGVKKQNIRKSI